MTKDDIYDHLAKVYIGKKKEVESQKKKGLSAWLVINLVITGVIFASSFYGLTAFLTQERSLFESRIILSLHNGPVRVEYNFTQDLNPTKTIALPVETFNVSGFKNINFSVRGETGSSLGIVKIVLTTTRNESSIHYIKNIGNGWTKISLPLDDFKEISDWNNLKTVSFVVESWNVDAQKGIVLIDDIHFSS